VGEPLKKKEQVGGGGVFFKPSKTKEKERISKNSFQNETTAPMEKKTPKFFFSIY